MDIHDVLLSLETMHHAYLAEGGAETAEEFEEALRTSGIIQERSPDTYVRVYEQFGIDDARAVRERASRKAFTGRNIFILTITSITTEAQNALLKTLEEPSPNTIFFLVVRSADSLLPTLRSRVQFLGTGKSKGRGTVDARVFISAIPSERLTMLTSVLEERDTTSAIALLSSLEEHLAAKDRRDVSSRRALKAVYTARRYIADKGSAMKALLENVALTVPRV